MNPVAGIDIGALTKTQCDFSGGGLKNGGNACIVL